MESQFYQIIYLQMKKLQAFLLLLLITTASTETIQIFSASTFLSSTSTSLSGSLRGGRTIYIDGIGFPTDPSLLQVWIGTYPCKIPADGVTPTTLSCETTDTFSEIDINNLEINVINEGQSYTVPSTTFNYASADTPTISKVFPFAAVAGTRLNYFARHRVLYVGDGLRDMGDFLGLYVGGTTCSMFDIAQDDITYSSINRAQCTQSPLQEGGRYNITEHVIAGWAQKEYTMRRPSFSGEHYEHTVFPEVMEVSPNSGYDTGQNIQIYGTGFSKDPSKIQVTVDSVPCDVDSSSLTYISCRIRAKQASDSSLIDLKNVTGATQTKGYIGSAGFDYARYDISELFYKSLSSFRNELPYLTNMSLVEQKKVLQLETPDIFGENYGQVFKGYFYAPVSGNYTFRGASDDQFVLLMNLVYGTTTGTLTQIISGSSAGSSPDNYHISNASSTMGTPRLLEGGQYYYMELYHINGPGAGWLKISVQVPNTDTTLSKQLYEVNHIETTYVNDPEILQFTLDGANGGSFNLSVTRTNSMLQVVYSKEVLIPHNTNAGDFQWYLNQFDSYSSAGTTCLNATGYDASGNQVALSASTKTKTVWVVQVYKLRTTAQLAERFRFKGNNLVNVTTATWTQTTLRDHGPLISGTFTMDIGGQSIRIYDTALKTYSIYNIPYNVTDSALQAGLRQIVGFEKVEVVRRGDPLYGAKWVISYVEYFQDVPQIVLSASRLAGGASGTSPQMGTYETRKYSSDLFFNPVSDDFLFTPANTANVIVKVNGIPSVCADCSYTFLNTAPQVTSQTKDGTGVTVSVTISDPLSSTYPTSDLTVKVDSQICTIVSGSYTSFSCTLPTNVGGSPKIRAGSYDVDVFIAGRGYASIQPNITTLDYDLILTSLSPNSGGINGGYSIQINGKGFPSDITQPVITLCGATLPITAITNIATTVTVLPCSSTGLSNISYTYNGITKTIPFSFTNATISQIISSISPSSFSPVQKGVMTIAGSGFGSTVGNIKAYISNSTGRIYQMRVLSVTGTQIKCGIPGGLPGVYFIEVTLAGVGKIPAVAANTTVFKYELVITSISPLTGPYYGGNLITINGINFSPDILETYVSIGNELNTLCAVETLTSTRITCRMPPTHPDWTNSTQQVIVTNKIILDSTCPGNNCRFTYGALASSPSITNISLSEADSGKGSLIISGNFVNATANNSVVLENRLTNVRTVSPIVIINSTHANFAVPNVPGGSYWVRVRIEPIGQTNSLPLKLKTSFAAENFTGSLKGGSMTLIGYGLPDAWPSRLFTLVITTSDGLPIPLNVLTTTTSKLEVAVPEVVASTTYTVTLTNPITQVSTARYIQATSGTPAVSITSPSPASSIATGQHLVTLTKTALTTSNGTYVKVYNTLNRDILYPVESFDQTSTTISFNFTFGSGQYGIKVFYNGFGWASCSQVLNVAATTAYSVSNFNSSFAGRRLQIIGDQIGSGALLKVGGFYGKVYDENLNDTTFDVPPLITPAVVAVHPELAQVQNVKPAAIISDGGTKPASAFDKLQTTYYQSVASTCYIGMDIGQSKLVDIQRVRFFPYYKWAVAARYIKGATIEGSVDGTAYTVLATVDQTVHAGWNSIQIPDSVTTNYRFIRLRHVPLSGCKVSQFEVYGTVYNNIPSDASSTTTSMRFTDGYNVYNYNNVLTYSNESTPVITTISPNNGTIYGGTNLTFTGTNLDVDGADPSVVIDGVECVVDIVHATSTSFTCVTGQRLDMPDVNTLTVMVGDQYAVVKDEFFYIMRWSDIRTWGTDLPPGEGDLVYVSKGMTLYVDQSTPRLDGIIVEDGKIIFADEIDMQIHTNFITVNRGQFRAGTENKPYQHQLTFIMYGSYYAKQQPMFGNKGIGCMQCKFSMYGTPRAKTWSLLASTINAGTSTVVVEDDTIDWQVGQEIVVASTSFDHNQAEQRTIIDVNGTTLTVDPPFDYKHVGIVETYGTNRLEMKAEVGLLSRNIKMMGDPTSQQGEYGSHLMMAGKGENGLVAHIAYTEFTRCGQPRIVGRYCIHFHMNGDVPDSYAKGNAVHHSFARVITIHGVHYLTVSENVGYRVKGHNFFVEDGIETDNLIQYNLAIGSLESWNMLQSDISVASFWITNPSNYVRFNRAAGGDFYGFWYEIKRNPDGPSATEDICPIGNPLAESHDNVAHSYKRFGLRIFKLASRTIPCQDIRDDTQADPWASNPSIESRFYNYLLYKNNEAGLLAEETGNVLFENFTIAESKLAGMQFYRTNLTRELVIARNSAIIALSQGNQDSNPSAIRGSRGVIAPRTSGWKISGIRFYNFPPTTVALETCSKCNDLLLYTNTAQEYFVDTISYFNFTGSYLFMNGQKRQIIYDTDSSYSTNFNSNTRTGLSTIAWSFNHLAADAACRPARITTDWDNALVCDNTVTIRKVMFANLVNPNVFSKSPMKIELIADQTVIVANDSTSFTQFKSYQGNMEPKKDKKQSYAIGLITNRVYNAWWLTGLDFTHLAIDISKNFQNSDAAIVIKFNYTENRELYEIGQLINKVFPINNMIAPTTSGPLNRQTCNFGDYTHDNENRTLTVCLTSRGRTQLFEYLDINGIKCRYLCPAPPGDVVKENFLRLWNNATQWPNQAMPVAGQNVTIPGEWTILMNISPQPMDFLQVDGDIIIPDTLLEANITARAIWIRTGSIKAGTSSVPYPGKINFKILGNKEDPGWVLNENVAGNKLFVIHGQLEIYGPSPSVTWGRLKATVRPGATSMSLTNSVTGWQIGDQIVIGPTFRNYSQHEKVTIQSITASTNTITFTPPLNYTHYGANTATVTNAVGTLDTRAAVGHITRNIKILSGSDEGWGYQMIVEGYFDGVKVRSGSVILQGVQFSNGGQYDTENTVLKIQNTVSEDPIKITKSSFHDCKSYCMDISNINNAFVQSNVFFNARVKHVRALKIESFTFNNNLMIAAIKRPTINAEQLIACYQTHEEISSTNSITSNLCQGSAMHGFVFPFFSCDQVDTPPYSDNTVGSAVIGFILNVIPGSCLASSGLKAYACDIGQICSPPGPEKIMFSKFMIADSHRGVTLRFGNEGDDRTAFLSNSYISAISRPNCAECYGTTAIDCTDNFAVRMLAVTVNGEHMPGKFGPGFDVICKQETYDAKAFLDNVIFENYNQTYVNLTQCSSNVLFMPHHSASDLTGSHHLSNVVCNGCQRTAMAYFSPPAVTQLNWFGGCGKIFCTGKNNYLIHDHTGSLLGTPSILLANNSVIGDNTPGCNFIPEINGHHCLRTDLAVLEYESIAPDFKTRIMWPVYLQFDGGAWNSTTNGWREWEWQGNQPLNHRMARFVSVIQLFQSYNMTFESEPPIDMRFQIQRRTTAGNNSDWLIVKIYYPRPNSIRVQNRFGVVKPITLLDNNGENPLNTSQCGSNKYFYQNYTIHFVVTGAKDCQVRVSLTNSIQLNARIDMDIDDFFRADGQTKFIDRMCAVLGITDTSRVKIVAVYRGSTLVKVSIDESSNTTVDNATSNDNQAGADEMEILQKKITRAVSNGSLGSALTEAGLGPLRDVHTQRFTHEDYISESPEDQPVQKVARSIGLIVGIAVGSVVLIAVGGAGFIYFIRKRAKISQLVELPVSEQKIAHTNNNMTENESLTTFGLGLKK